jgi:glutamate:GABA antiporter
MSSNTSTSSPSSATEQVMPGEALPSESYAERAMPRVLKTADLFCLFVLILFFITNIGNAAAGGPSGLTLWVIGGLFFFLPCGIATMQLGALFPFEGGIYNWTYRTFGRGVSVFVGFIAWAPGPLLILATAELVVNIVQGENAKWLADPRSQGFALLGIIAFSCIVALQRQAMLQVMIKGVFILILIATGLVFVAGLVWLLHGHPSATDFRLSGSWNPFTSGNFPLFGVITLGYLGTNLPLNQGGELAAPHGSARRRAITGHVLWGSLLVLAFYLASTFGVLAVQGQSASFSLFAPISTVEMALGPVAGGAAAVCIMATLVVATIVYNTVFARFLLAGAIDQRIPVRWGKLNHNRVPAGVIILQASIAGVLAALFFLVVPYVGILSGSPAHLAASLYFVLVGTATILWAVGTIFLFVNLLWLLMRKGAILRRLWIFPSWVLALSALVGLAVGIVAIVDTIQNSYDPPDIPNATWFIVVSILSGIFLIIGALGGMVASGEASWQGMSGLE